MSGRNKSPAYNLKVVVRETGIKPDTLRAWERRYGLPKPQRTPGKHRLYSQYDIEMIKWLIERQKEGLRINRAVQLWRSLEEDGQDPLQAMPFSEPVDYQVPAEVVSGSTISEFSENWVAACLDFDESRAENVLAQAFARYSLETVCLGVLREGLAAIGDQWYSSKSTVQQEHFASALAMRRINALLAAAPPPTRGNRILVACPPGEDHVFPLILVTLFLRQRGWEVIYLGGNVPLEKLDATIQSSKPDLIVSSAQQLSTAANLFEVAEYLQSEGVLLAYGGMIFNLLPELCDRIPGLFLGESLEQVVQVVENIMANPKRIPMVESVSNDYLQVYAQFKEYRPRIEAHLWEQFQTNGMNKYHLEIANEFLGGDIEAALFLGEMSLLRSDIDWLKGLLIYHDIPVELLSKYLQLYKGAIEVNLGSQGRPIVEWLKSVLQK
jgi:DNA-binding transcriptional MerR regulator